MAAIKHTMDSVLFNNIQSVFFCHLPGGRVFPVWLLRKQEYGDLVFPVWLLKSQGSVFPVWLLDL